MVLDSKQTTVAYRCPYCGAGIMSAVGLFSLSADIIKLKCDCGHSEMSVAYTKDGKVRLTVPCIFCPRPHTFTVSSTLFFGRDLFVMACPYSDINISFTGEADRIKTELARTELELLDILEANGISSFAALHGEEEKILTDPQIFDIIMFVIHDLEAENKIFCRCKAGEGEYDAEVLDDAIRISCKKCGAMRYVPTDSLLGAHAFLNCDSLYLE